MKKFIQTQKGSIAPVIIAIIVLLVAVVVYIAIKNKPASIVDVAVPNGSNAASSYVNSKFGFSFEYPANYHTSSAVSNVPYYNYEITNVAEASTTENYIDNATFDVSADNSPSNLGSCLTNDYGVKPYMSTTTRSINGNDFYVFNDKVGDAAMGGARGQISEYRIIHNGFCYIINYHVYWHIVGYAGYVNTGKVSATPEETQAQTDAINRNEQALENIFSSFKFTDGTSSATTPFIASITPSSGPIGTTIELKGTNLAGFEGDLNAWIVNSKGETAFLPGIGSVPRADQTIRVKIDGQLCKQDNSNKGGPCTSFITITPGVYSIYTQPWGNKSNSVRFTVTTSNSSLNSAANSNSNNADTLNWQMYSNPEFGFQVRYPATAYLDSPGAVMSNVSLASSSIMIVGYNGVSLNINVRNNGTPGANIPCNDQNQFSAGNPVTYYGITYTQSITYVIGNGDVYYTGNYCTVHNGIKYIVNIWVSPIVGDNFPDKATCEAKFNQAMNDLRFTFTATYK